MQYIVDINKLCKGDVILRRWPQSNMSKRIMEETHSNYSHALLCVDYSSVIDAGKIVQSKNPLRDSFENKDDALVLRLKPQFGDYSVVGKAVEYARRTIGTQYSFSEAKEVLNDTEYAKEPNRQICTRLIAKAYEYGRVSIVENSNYPTIRDLENSSMVEKVNDCIMEVTPQIQKVIDSECLIPKQTEIIDRLLSDCRKLYPDIDIQTFEQLIYVSINYPEKNDLLAQLIKESGYLNLWKEEESLNPYNFDSSLFIKEMGEHSHIAAMQSLEANHQCYERYNSMLVVFRQIMNCGNPVVDLLGNLYDNLVDQCNRRQEVLNEVLKTPLNQRIYIK